MKFRPLKPVNLNFFKTANLSVTSVIEAKCTQELLMETIRGTTIWTEWAFAITNVDWTCKKPYGLNSTRTVSMLGGLTVKELFFHWQENQHVAFYVTESNIPCMESFAEDYLIEDLGNGITRLTWTVAMQMTGIFRIFAPVSKFFTGIVLQSWLNKYKKLLEAQ